MENCEYPLDPGRHMEKGGYLAGAIGRASDSRDARPVIWTERR